MLIIEHIPFRSCEYAQSITAHPQRLRLDSEFCLFRSLCQTPEFYSSYNSVAANPLITKRRSKPERSSPPSLSRFQLRLYGLGDGRCGGMPKPPVFILGDSAVSASLPPGIAETVEHPPRHPSHPSKVRREGNG